MASKLIPKDVWNDSKQSAEHAINQGKLLPKNWVVASIIVLLWLIISVLIGEWLWSSLSK